jgi:hypothetical protein
MKKQNRFLFRADSHVAGERRWQLIPRLLLAVFLLLGQASAQSPAPLRPPATPLIAHDPYFSVWSMNDTLNAEPSKHWTGSEQPLTGLARIDGSTYRFMGVSPRWAEPTIQPMKQVGFQLTPMRTIYSFEQGGVRLDFTFLTPALPHDLEILSRPVTYLIWEARATDGKEHKVKLYLDATSHLVVNRVEERAMWSRHRVGAAPVTANAMIAYDDQFSIEYFHRKLRPYWRRNNRAGAADLLKTAARDFSSLKERCEKFDAELTADLVKAGGAKYAAVRPENPVRQWILAFTSSDNNTFRLGRLSFVITPSRLSPATFLPFQPLRFVAFTVSLIGCDAWPIKVRKVSASS